MFFLSSNSGGKSLFQSLEPGASDGVIHTAAAFSEYNLLLFANTDNALTLPLVPLRGSRLTLNVTTTVGLIGLKFGTHIHVSPWVLFLTNLAAFNQNFNLFNTLIYYQIPDKLMISLSCTLCSDDKQILAC